MALEARGAADDLLRSRPRPRASSRDVVAVAGPCVRSSVLPQFARYRSNWQPNLPGGLYCYQACPGSPQGSGKYEPIARIREARQGADQSRAVLNVEISIGTRLPFNLTEGHKIQQERSVQN